MNFYEKEMRDFFGNSELLQDAHFCGRTCLARLDEDLRVKLQLTTTGIIDQYDAIKLSIINRTDGVVDQQLFHFSDIIGKQLRNGRDAIEPHIWEYDGKPSWYLPITRADRTQIADTILDYVGMYQDESIGMTGPGM